MEYGYFLDVLVRKVVMFVVIKLVGGFYFVDFLRVFVKYKKEIEILIFFFLENKYMFFLVLELFVNLWVVLINEYNVKLKDSLLDNLGDFDELKLFCEDFKKVIKGFCDEDWVDVVVFKIMFLVYFLEVERK